MHTDQKRTGLSNRGDDAPRLPPLRWLPPPRGWGLGIPDAVRQVVLYFVDIALFWTLPKYQKRPNEICVVRTDHIGDFLFWRSAARALREHFPSPLHRITLVASAKWAELARESEFFDEIVELDTERFKSLAGLAFPWNIKWRRDLLRNLRRAGFETTVFPLYGRNYEGNVIVRATGAAQRIAMRGDVTGESGFMRWLTARWFTQVVADLPVDVSDLQRNAHFLRSMGVRCPELSLEPLKISVDRASPRVRQLIHGPPAVLIFPGASMPIRRWPAENFAAVVRWLHQRTGWRFWICGGREEYGLFATFLDLCRDIPVENLIGQTSLIDLAVLIKSSRLVISNETSAIHFAAAMDVPGVAILGGGHFGRFLPYPARPSRSSSTQLPVFHPMECFHCEWHCKYRIHSSKPAPCILLVEVAAVQAAIEHVLDEGTTPRSHHA
ncbi:MAG TPA: glycosyltransferase family 9 protein [Tepidisphaeraceae bacterium]|nr:glycosyltransferase family 9 protein [Tepidisphaeraceae bacterium]